MTRFSYSSKQDIENVNTPLIPSTTAWTLKRFQESHDKKSVLLEVQFQNVSQYKGVKILLFKNCSMVDIINQKQIDPHFLDDNRIKYPVARFIPTEAGWKMGLICLNDTYTGHREWRFLVQQ